MAADLVLNNLELIMAATLFLIGVASTVSGLWIILSKEYHQAMRHLSNQAIKINGRAITQDAVAPIIDSASRLVEAINALIRTAAGIGAFLTVAGVIISTLAFWMTRQL